MTTSACSCLQDSSSRSIGCIRCFFRFFRQPPTRTVVAQEWNTPITTSFPLQGHIFNKVTPAEAGIQEG